MPAVSKTGNLICKNPKLRSLPPPFREYYAYYMLGTNLKDCLDEFLKTEAEYVESMGIAFKNVLEKRDVVSAFVSSFDGSNVDSKATYNLVQLLNGLNTGRGDRSKIRAFDFEKIDTVRETYGFNQKDKLISDKRIQEFWLRLKKCVKETSQENHTDQDFMDLLSAFCGFDNFEAYLNGTFGEDYQADKDPIYQALITGSAIGRSETSFRKSFNQPPRILKANAVSRLKPEYFIGREDELFRITDKLHKYGGLVINGEGGMGKTTIAAEYYHRSIENRTYKNVAWLFCGHGVLPSIYELAPAFGLELTELDDSDKLLMIRHSLKTIEDDFLLVLDNVDGEIEEFLMEFQGFKWHLLITSRGRLEWEAIEEYRLPPLSTVAAKALFNTYYRDETGQAPESGKQYEISLDILISAIGYNTLLIEVFSKQLAKEFYDYDGEKFGIQEFVNRLEQNGLYLEESVGRVLTNYVFYRRENVATTTEILDILYDFSNLNTELRTLLVNLALLPADMYSLKFLFELFQPDNRGTFHSRLQELFSLGWLGGDGRTHFRLSPVVQGLALKKNSSTLWREGKALVKRVSSLMSGKLNKDNLYTERMWLRIADNMERNINYTPEAWYAQFVISFIVLLRHVNGKDNLQRSAVLLKQALEADINKFGESSSTVAIIRSNLALVLQDLGGKENLQAAVELLENALKADIINFGINSSTVAMRRSNLGSALIDIGGKENLQTAVQFLEEALEYEINISKNAATAAVRRSNLALALQDIGGKENQLRATELLEKALDDSTIHLGEETPTVAIARSNLALALQDIGGKKNLIRATKLLQKALASSIKNFGNDAPTTTTWRSNLATVLQEMGGINNLNRAAELLERAVNTDIKNFGEDAPKVAIKHSNLALVLKDIGGNKNLERAVNLLEKALVSSIKSFGDDAPKVSIMRSNLALVLKDIGGNENLKRSEQLLKSAIKDDVKNFGKGAATAAISHFNLATVLIDIGGKKNLLRAKKGLNLALASATLNFREDHPTIDAIRSYLSSIEKELKNG